MKKIWLAISLLIIIIIVAAGCEGITSPPIRTPTTGGSSAAANTGIWVTGMGEVKVVPDIAILQVGVEAQEATVSQAMARASEAMGKVGMALTNNGIEAQDIQTQYFSVRQRTRWNDQTDQEIVTGYRVTNRMTVKIRVSPVESVTLDYKASQIIDAVAAAGGDLIRIDDFSFSVEDPSLYYDEAREKATADALAKAEKLAEQTGVKLGAPIYISENAATSTVFEGMTFAASSVPVPAPAITIPPTSPGEVKVSLTVQIAYSIY